MGGTVPSINHIGGKVERDYAEFLRSQVAQILNRRQKSFPGAQPVSFSAKHLKELQKRDYYVTEKSDGIRCLLYCTTDLNHEPTEIHFLIDRKNDYYFIENLHFPIAEDPSFQKHHTDTIVDGELVMDTMEDKSEKMKYLVFDCLALDGNSLLDRPLDKRLAYFREKIFLPFQALLKRWPEYSDSLPFFIEFKASQKSYGVEMMFREIIPKLRHGNDGLIFTCRETAYKSGTDEHILKWKPPQENSVDFRMAMEFPLQEPNSEDEEDEDGNKVPPYDYTAMPTFHLFVSEGDGKHSKWGTMHMEQDEWERLKKLNQRLDETIVECYQDSEHRWRFLRFRDDKHDPNHISSVRSIMESIQDGISEADLMRNAKATRDQWKLRETTETDPRRRAELEDIRRQELQKEREAEAARRAGSRHGTPGGGVKRMADEISSDGPPESDKKARTELDGTERLALRTGENGIPTPEGSVGTDQATGSQPRADDHRDGETTSRGGSTSAERRTSVDES